MPESAVAEPPATQQQAPAAREFAFQPFADIDDLLAAKAVNPIDLTPEEATAAQKLAPGSVQEKSGVPTPPDAKNAPQTPERAPTAPTEAPKPGTTKPDEPPKAAPAKPPEPTPAKPIEKMAPKELRQAYEDLKARHRQIEETHAKLTKEHEELKAKPAEDPRVKALTTDLESRAKRIADLEEKLKFKAYEETDEYRERYWQPYVDAFQQGRQRVAGIKTVNDTGEIVSHTAEEFDSIMRIADDNAAADAIESMFGTGAKADMVIRLRERVLELNGARHNAIETYRKTGAEREKQSEQMLTAQQARCKEIYDKATQEDTERFEWFKPDDKDPQTAKLLEAGRALVDRVRPENLPPEEVARGAAAIRLRAAAFSRLIYEVTKREARIKELETELTQFKQSQPPGGQPTRTTPVPEDPYDAVDAAIDRVAVPDVR